MALLSLVPPLHRYWWYRHRVAVPGAAVMLLLLVLPLRCWCWCCYRVTITGATITPMSHTPYITTAAGIAITIAVLPCC